MKAWKVRQKIDNVLKRNRFNKQDGIKKNLIPADEIRLLLDLKEKLELPRGKTREVLIKDFIPAYVAAWKEEFPEMIQTVMDEKVAKLKVIFQFGIDYGVISDGVVDLEVKERVITQGVKE
jgi:hypothetical protein